MKNISVLNSEDAIIDDQDYDLFSTLKWSRSGNGDVQAWFDGGMVSMHALVMGKNPGFEIDHKNRNKLHNYRENLRFCTRPQNSANKVKYSNNTSGYKGVTWEKSTGKFAARITVNYKSITLGRFETAKEGAQAYNDAALFHFGEFARLNEI